MSHWGVRLENDWVVENAGGHVIAIRDFLSNDNSEPVMVCMSSDCIAIVGNLASTGWTKVEEFRENWFEFYDDKEVVIATTKGAWRCFAHEVFPNVALDEIMNAWIKFGETVSGKAVKYSVFA